MRTLLLLTSVVAVPACGTSNASVPSIDGKAALRLVLDDLNALLEQPDAVHWRRTYRHFDRHVEPLLNDAERLEMEVAFGKLRSELGANTARGTIARLRSRIEALSSRLQPQD